MMDGWVDDRREGGRVACLQNIFWMEASLLLCKEKTEAELECISRPPGMGKSFFCFFASMLVTGTGGWQIANCARV